MKYSAFWLLIFLLTATSVWAMEHPEEKGASRWNPPQIKQTEDSSPILPFQLNPPEDPATAVGDPYAPRWGQEMTTPQIPIVCKGNPFDPRPAPTPVHVLKATSQLGGTIDLKLTGLTQLYLERNKLGDEGAKALASSNLLVLTSLDLWGNKIENEGASSNLSGLKELALRENNIGEEEKNSLNDKIWK